MDLPKTFCPAPWMSISTDVNGSIRPCCRYVQPNQQTEHKMPYMKDGKLHDVYNNPSMQKLRESFIKGEKPKECYWCWKEESTGVQSFRQRYLEKGYDIDFGKEEHTPRILDLKLSNTCNLKCRMCSPMASSLIGKEMGVYDPYWSENKIIGTDNEESFFNKILPNVREIELTGGEPFFSNENQALLLKISETDHVNNIDKIYITTNGMVYSKRLFNALDKFKCVEIAVSVDDVGPRLAYARHGANWNTIKNNISKFLQHSNVDAFLTRTINLLNVLHLDELEDEAKDMGVKLSSAFLHEPHYLGIQHLPSEVKQMISSELGDNYITKFMNGVNDESYHNVHKFLSEMRKLDVIRKESFEDTFPELYDLISWIE